MRFYIKTLFCEEQKLSQLIAKQQNISIFRLKVLNKDPAMYEPNPILNSLQYINFNWGILEK